jgi:hypothetical protein
MVMKIEVAESWTDYSSVGTPPCSLSMNWLMTNTSTSWFALSASTLDVADRSLKMLDANQVQTITYMFAVPVTKITVAFNFNWYEFGTTQMLRMFSILTASGAVQFYWNINTVGKMVVYGEGGAIVATSEMNFLNDIVYRCCIRVEYTGTNTANLDISVNGYNDPGLSKVGVDLQDQADTTMGGVQIQCGNSAANDPGQWELIDLMVGTGECVDWGPIELVDLYAIDDVVVGWTPFSGVDNWAMIDEPQADGDTTYNYTETLNAKDIFDYQDGSTPESVVAVGFCSWHRKEDSATRRWRHILRLDGVDYNGPDVYASETYGRRIDFWVENPDTAAPWEPTELAAVQGGYEYLGA